MPALSCPLCLGADAQFLHRSDDRHGVRAFYVCSSCDLVFVPPEYHLDPCDEMARYRMHDNDPADPDYRAFLMRLWKVFRPRIRPGAKGLDFGCGPGPALAQMMEEDGFKVTLYDIYFFPDQTALTDRYEFISCTETLEHLRSPRETFSMLDSLLKPGGQLGVMTGMWDEIGDFAQWYYHRDPTHVAFYSRPTMRWISDHMGWSVDFPADNLTIFTRPG